ncbi:MAG: hypothetical protein ACJASF_002427 [Vicingaceae bacterium]|jgi:hypothetical protein
MFKPRRIFKTTVIPRNKVGRCEVLFDDFPDDLTISIYNAMGFRKPKNSLVFISEVENDSLSVEFALLMQSCLKVGEYPIDIPYEPSFIPIKTNIEVGQFSIFSIQYENSEGKLDTDIQLSFEPHEIKKNGIANLYGLTKYGDNFISATVAKRPTKTIAKELFLKENVVAAFPFPLGNGLSNKSKNEVNQKLEEPNFSKLETENLPVNSVNNSSNSEQNVEETLEVKKEVIPLNDIESITQISVTPESVIDVETQKSVTPQSVTDVITQKSVSPRGVIDIATPQSESSINETDKEPQKSVTPQSVVDIVTQKSVTPDSVIDIKTQKSVALKRVTDIVTQEKDSSKKELLLADSNIQKANFQIILKLIPELFQHIERGVKYSESLSTVSRYSRVIFKVQSETIGNLIDVSLESKTRETKSGYDSNIFLRLNQAKKKCIIVNSNLKNGKGDLLIHPDFKPKDFGLWVKELLRDGHLFALYEEEVNVISKDALTKKVATELHAFSPIETILLTADETVEFNSWETANDWLRSQTKEPYEQNGIIYKVKWQSGDELIADFELFSENYHPQFDTELLQKAVIHQLLKNHYHQDKRYTEQVNSKTVFLKPKGFYLSLLDKVDSGNLKQKNIDDYQPKIPAISVEVKTNIITTENKYESSRKFDLANDFLKLLKTHCDPEELIQITAIWKNESFIATQIKAVSIPSKPNAAFWKTIFQSKINNENFNKYQTSDDDPLLFDSEIVFKTPKFYYHNLESAYWHESDTDLNQKFHYSGYSYHIHYLGKAIQNYLNILAEDDENEIIGLANNSNRQKVLLQFIIEYKKLGKNDYNLQFSQTVQLIEKAVKKQDKNSKLALHGLLLNLQIGEKLISLPKSRIQKVDIKDKPTKESKRIKLNREIEAIVDKNGNYLTKYSLEDLVLLKQYSGYGGSKLSEVNRGLLYEYYTPDEIIKFMWGFAFKHGYESGAVLEPSCGIGKFFEYAPNGVRIEGYETNKFSAQIAQILYPTAIIHNKSFENLFFNGNVYLKGKFRSEPFDLVIGNPPYGAFSGRFAGMGEKKRTKAFTYDQYFLTRGLDLLNKSGLLIMVIPQSFLDNNSKYNTLKEMVMAKADFLEARRLPHGIFQHTEIGTDIVVFRKK